MAVIGINYDEGSEKKGLGYKSVYLYTHNHGELVFDTGDFVKDWYNAKKKYIDISDEEHHFLHSSSVNHFIMDGAEFDSAWLVVNDGTPNLKYEFNEEGWEMFVNKGTQPTWEELKQYVKGE